MTCFSFHPVKHITTGEGGAITTRSEALYKRLLLLRTHGITRDPAEMTHVEGPWYYEMVALGWNYRISDIQCALGRSQLRRLSRWVARRREIAAEYREGFAGVEGIVTPAEPDGFESSYHLYPLWFDEALIGRTRREIFESLREAGLGVQVHYIPAHLQPFYRQRFGTGPGQFPEAERFYRGEISIPMYPQLTGDDVKRVIETVTTAVRRPTQP
jgi:dTDP-4-amino-4,6-dideoxygalactose transaminase